MSDFNTINENGHCAMDSDVNSLNSLNSLSNVNDASNARWDSEEDEKKTLADEMDFFADDFEQQIPPEKKERMFREKYQKASQTCRNQMERMVRDLRKADGNPYIRSSLTYRYEIYRNRSDEKPIDVFNVERKMDYSFMSYLLAGAIVSGVKFAFHKFRG